MVGYPLLSEIAITLLGILARFGCYLTYRHLFRLLDSSNDTFSKYDRIWWKEHPYDEKVREKRGLFEIHREVRSLVECGLIRISDVKIYDPIPLSEPLYTDCPYFAPGAPFSLTCDELLDIVDKLDSRAAGASSKKKQKYDLLSITQKGAEAVGATCFIHDNLRDLAFLSRQLQYVEALVSLQEPRNHSFETQLVLEFNPGSRLWVGLPWLRAANNNCNAPSWTEGPDVALVVDGTVRLTIYAGFETKFWYPENRPEGTEAKTYFEELVRKIGEAAFRDRIAVQFW